MKKTVKQLKRVEAAYLEPTAQAAADAGDSEPLGEVMRVVGPAFADLRAVASEDEQIRSNSNLSATGRTTALAALDAKRRQWAAEHGPRLQAALAAVQKSMAHAIDASWRGLIPTEDGKSHVLRNHTSTDPGQIALDSEARGYWRTLDPQKFRELYRQWVVEDDARARIAENDPTGTLLTAPDLAWARQVRIESSPLKARLSVLQAQVRSLQLAAETIRMEFESPVAEVASAG